MIFRKTVKEETKKAILINAAEAAELGFNFLYSNGGKKTNAKAAFWFEKALLLSPQNAWDLEVVAQLALMKEVGEEVPVDKAGAYCFYELIAQVPEASRNLTKRFFPVGERPASPIKIPTPDLWFKAVANTENAATAMELGVMFFTGEEIPEDKAKAVYWFEIGAKAGNLTAAKTLGCMFLYGTGVKEDEKKARYWFEICDRFLT